MHGIYRVQSFEIISPYTLRIGFDDGSEQMIDFEPVLTGELDLSMFHARLKRIFSLAV